MYFVQANNKIDIQPNNFKGTVCHILQLNKFYQYNIPRTKRISTTGRTASDTIVWRNTCTHVGR